MDLYEQGKSLALEGHYEEALDAFILAQENDKENPDIHFYLGLCYSSLENFPYAKYHYEIALKLKPNHEKTRLVINGLKDVESQKPPERRISRQAAAKIRRAPEPAEKEESDADAPDKPPTLQKQSAKLVYTDQKWEQAFPSDSIMKEEKDGIFLKIVFILIGIALVAALVYFGLSFIRT